ncbi:MFS transporter [Actinomadura sp. WAC 06369]|uniref:MFS transporter n=1 Tax=Actinomadura sp. WAC 06369 TaxID=2203193 RepID=UPI000F797DCF|nr:MFS transporter [Actinomadura sp. WAC 06369]RSN70172.1 MFS transporter [Actinomadura sp. WAC 06369]
MTTALHPDGAEARDEPRVLGPGYRGPTFGIVFVVTLLAFESMAVTTVMPAVAADLHGLGLYAWGFSATLIAGLLSTVLAGGWIDRSGPMRPFLIGLGTFVAGLAVAGAAPAMWVFVAGRAVQGIGTGLAMVAMYVVVARIYPESLRARVFAAESAAWVLPALVGPAVGGVLAEHVGWRWVFLGLIPLVVPPTLLLVRALRGTEPPERAPGASVPGGRAVAAVAVAVGAAVFLYGLDAPGWAIVPAVAAGLAGLAFGLPRLLPAGTFRMRRGLPSIILTRGLLSGAFMGTDVFIPLALTSLHGFGPAEAGIVLTVAALGWSAASQYQGRSKRSRAFFVRLGAVCVTAGIAAVTVALRLGGWAAAPAWLIGGAGMGLAVGSLSVLLLAGSSEEEQGVNSSALQIGDMLGTSVVVGTAGALVAAFGPDRLELGLTAAGTALAAVAALGIAAALRLEART